MHIKTVPLSVKSAGPDDELAEGEFFGYASVFGNVDSGGDMVMKGAFLESLNDYTAKGEVLPVLWGHDMADPFANIGSALKATEDEHGLLIHGKLDLENPKAAQVYRLLKGRRVNQMSFAYDVLEGAWIDQKAADDGTRIDPYYEIRKAKIYEVSVVPIGMNQATSIESVKSAEFKIGRVLSAKNENALKAAQKQLADAAQVLSEVLSQLESSDGNDEDSKASTDRPAKSEDRASDKDEEPSETVSVESTSSDENHTSDDDALESADDDLVLELELLGLNNSDDAEEGDQE